MTDGDEVYLVPHKDGRPMEEMYVYRWEENQVYRAEYMKQVEDIGWDRPQREETLQSVDGTIGGLRHPRTI